MQRVVPMKGFLKRNFVLILGISLPLLLIAVLLLVHGISRLVASKPAYPVLYVSFENYGGQQFYDFDIDDAGHLAIGFMRPEANPAIRRQPPDAILALFDARSDTLETFSVQAPDDPPNGVRIDLPIPAKLSELTFSGRSMAPDGYRLELSAYRSRGLLREIFGTGGRSRHHRLVNDGVSFRVPDIVNSSYSRQNTFVGWVVGGDE